MKKVNVVKEQFKTLRNVHGWAVTTTSGILSLYEDFDEAFKYCLNHYWQCVLDDSQQTIKELSLEPTDTLIVPEKLYKAFTHVDEGATAIIGKEMCTNWVVYMTCQRKLTDIIPVAHFKTVKEALAYCKSRDWSCPGYRSVEALFIAQGCTYTVLYKGHTEY